MDLHKTSGVERYYFIVGFFAKYDVKGSLAEFYYIFAKLLRIAHHSRCFPLVVRLVISTLNTNKQQTSVTDGLCGRLLIPKLWRIPHCYCAQSKVRNDVAGALQGCGDRHLAVYIASPREKVRLSLELLP